MNRQIAHEDDGTCIRKETMRCLIIAREVKATAGCSWILGMQMYGHSTWHDHEL